MSEHNSTVDNSQNSRCFAACWLTLLRDFKIITNQDTQIFLLSDIFKLLITHVIWIFLLWCTNMHDFTFAGICHFSDQVVSLDKSSWSECQSLSSVIRVNILVSSANFKIQLSIPNSKSLTYIRNSSGPSTDLCGTPLKTSTQSDKTPLIPTFCFLPLATR